MIFEILFLLLAVLNAAFLVADFIWKTGVDKRLQYHHERILELEKRK